MKTRIISIILALIIMICETSCFLRVGGRKHGVAAGVGYLNTPVENKQAKSSAVSFQQFEDSVTTASKQLPGSESVE